MLNIIHGILFCFTDEIKDLCWSDWNILKIFIWTRKLTQLSYSDVFSLTFHLISWWFSPLNQRILCSFIGKHMFCPLGLKQKPRDFRWRMWNGLNTVPCGTPQGSQTSSLWPQLPRSLHFLLQCSPAGSKPVTPICQQWDFSWIWINNL